MFKTLERMICKAGCVSKAFFYKVLKYLILSKVSIGLPHRYVNAQPLCLLVVPGKVLSLLPDNSAQYFGGSDCFAYTVWFGKNHCLIFCTTFFFPGSNEGCQSYTTLKTKSNHTDIKWHCNNQQEIKSGSNILIYLSCCSHWGKGYYIKNMK